MKNFIESGDVIDYTASGTITSGQIVAVGKLIGVASKSGVSGDVIPVYLKGVFTLGKEADVIAAGDKLYFKSSNGTVTTTSSGNTFCGYAWAAAADTDTTVAVKLWAI